MSGLKIFNNPEFGAIRAVEINGEPWFVGKDVARALGYKNPRQAISTNVDDEDRGVHSVDTPSGPQDMTVINESGLYSLILSSKLPSAKKFKRWVTHDVLPAIRRNGYYSMVPAPRFPALPDGVTFSSAVGFMRLTRRVMLDMGASPFDVGMMIKETCEAISFPVPPALNRQITGQLDLFARPGLEAAQ